MRRSNLPPDTRRRAGPDRAAALAQYRGRAATYDLELRPFEPLRREAIAALALQPGQTVLDVGCGTGLSLPALGQGVCGGGQVIGIEQSAEMLAVARARERARAAAAVAAGEGRVHLHHSPVEEARLVGLADAALFHFTHDVLRSQAALDHVLRHLRPGARIVATGLQWAPPWALPVNAFVAAAAWRSVSTYAGLERPWDLLAERCQVQQVHTRLFGGVYLLVAER
ncbi:MAG: methyltransferase domain-containing protein [Burkholderiales bacterium]|jgi:demethylmenaquinone methyltransferase/2-methoxy-6-polyprenyl-1,4-benzoquinol methylase